MPDTRARSNAVTMRNRQHGGSKGAGLNRPCARCVYPCTGGETLHTHKARKGQEAGARACCRTFCPCLGFEPAPVQSRHGALNQSVFVQLNGRGRGPS